MTAPATPQTVSKAAITTITVEQYRALQDRVTRQTVAPALAVLQTLSRGSGIPDSTWQRLLAALFPVVLRGRDQSRNLAAAFFAGQSPQRSAPPIPTSAYDVQALNDALTRTARTGLAAPERTIALQAATDGAAAVGRHVEMAGRDFIRQASVADTNVDGWARAARGAKTCSFCLMLISRGPVYKSARSAGALEDGSMDRWHDYCDCVAVPVFDREDWPGRDQYLEAERLYAEATAGKQGVEAIRAFRSAVEAA